MCRISLPDISCALSDDSLLGNKVRLLQPVSGHRAGTDAVLLAAAIPEQGSLVDAGASTGAVGLMAALKNRERETWFIEQSSEMSRICEKNIHNNGLKHARIITESIFDRKKLEREGLNPLSADCVATNPPYFTAGAVQPSPDKGKAEAHILVNETLSGWIRACARLLKPKGYLCLVHKADATSEILSALEPLFGDIHLRFIHPGKDRPAHRLIIRARKHSRSPLKILFPLILHSDPGIFTSEAEALHKGEQLFLFK